MTGPARRASAAWKVLTGTGTAATAGLGLLVFVCVLVAVAAPRQSLGLRTRALKTPASSSAATSIFVPPKSTPMRIMDTVVPPRARGVHPSPAAGQDRSAATPARESLAVAVCVRAA